MNKEVYEKLLEELQSASSNHMRRALEKEQLLQDLREAQSLEEIETIFQCTPLMFRQHIVQTWCSKLAQDVHTPEELGKRATTCPYPLRAHLVEEFRRRLIKWMEIQQSLKNIEHYYEHTPPELLSMMEKYYTDRLAEELTTSKKQPLLILIEQYQSCPAPVRILIEFSFHHYVQLANFDALNRMMEFPELPENFKLLIYNQYYHLFQYEAENILMVDEIGDEVPLEKKILGKKDVGKTIQEMYQKAHQLFQPIILEVIMKLAAKAET